MGLMKKTSKEYCMDCKYHFGGETSGSKSRVCCVYILKTGERRNCPVGFCDKFEKCEGKEQKVIPWESEILEMSELMS